MACVPASHEEHHVDTNHTSVGWPRSEAMDTDGPCSVEKLAFGARDPTAGALAAAAPRLAELPEDMPRLRTTPTIRTTARSPAPTVHDNQRMLALLFLAWEGRKPRCSRRRRALLTSAPGVRDYEFARSSLDTPCTARLAAEGASRSRPRQGQHRPLPSAARRGATAQPGRSEPR